MLPRRSHWTRSGKEMHKRAWTHTQPDAIFHAIFLFLLVDTRIHFKVIRLQRKWGQAAFGPPHCPEDTPSRMGLKPTQDGWDTEAGLLLEDWELLWHPALAQGLPNGFAKIFLDSLAVIQDTPTPPCVLSPSFRVRPALRSHEKKSQFFSYLFLLVKFLHP